MFSILFNCTLTAGTTDGPGEFDFTQGDLTGNPFWDFISGLLKDPSPEQEACHAPKPILLDTGGLMFPYPWHPTSVDTQILRVGQLAILAVPAVYKRQLRHVVRVRGLVLPPPGLAQEPAERGDQRRDPGPVLGPRRPAAAHNLAVDGLAALDQLHRVGALKPLPVQNLHFGLLVGICKIKRITTDPKDPLNVFIPKP